MADKDIEDLLSMRDYLDLVDTLKEKYNGELLTIESQIDMQVSVLNLLRKRGIFDGHRG